MFPAECFVWGLGPIKDDFKFRTEYKIEKTQNVERINLIFFVPNKGVYQGGSIIYFCESFSVSMDKVNDFLKNVFHFYGLKKSLDIIF